MLPLSPVLLGACAIVFGFLGKECMAGFPSCASTLDPGANGFFQQGYEKVQNATALEPLLCGNTSFNCSVPGTVDQIVSYLTQAISDFVNVVNAYNTYLGNTISYPYRCPTVPLECSCALIETLFGEINNYADAYVMGYDSFVNSFTNCDFRAGELRDLVITIVCNIEVLLNYLTVCGLVCDASTCATTTTVPITTTTTVPVSTTTTIPVTTTETTTVPVSTTTTIPVTTTETTSVSVTTTTTVPLSTTTTIPVTTTETTTVPVSTTTTIPVTTTETTVTTVPTTVPVSATTTVPISVSTTTTVPISATTTVPVTTTATVDTTTTFSSTVSTTAAVTTTAAILTTSTVPITTTTTIDIFETTFVISTTTKSFLTTSTVQVITSTAICTRPVPTHCCRQDIGRGLRPLLTVFGAAKQDDNEAEAANVNVNAAVLRLLGSKRPPSESDEVCTLRRLVVENDD